MQDVMRRGGLRPLVIAIDAGHGGQDPGARGPAGSREKMITLAIARELARQVNATPGLKAYLTRDTDVFIPLTQRYQKARAAKADLFVSIHADSFTNPNANGSSVFVLSQRGASSQAARWLASQDNAADLVGGVKLQDKDDTLASVLLDLSQSATMKASEDMASQVLGGLKRLGRTHKGEVERANFVVLRSPDVPSMLVETAFISNPDEERRLNDPAHQSQLARAILTGVTTYFTRQPPPGTLYAARADAGSQGVAGQGIAGGGSR
jgi:N-acetylmuramoyl-L-alanine amidase